MKAIALEFDGFLDGAQVIAPIKRMPRTEIAGPAHARLAGVILLAMGALSTDCLERACLIRWPIFTQVRRKSACATVVE